ncbi:hypothetical protein CEXT_478911 [Caerostris extrusa]|uniref:Uncharacterized protein n=1 Tax=Caerostris extrusa TaxID=172846 RepID=A0AAV4WR65_CAEEX|nr:hypothetical protein CEXT_478911 [Caerostris extrusa]
MRFIEPIDLEVTKGFTFSSLVNLRNITEPNAFHSHHKSNVFQCRRNCPENHGNSILGTLIVFKYCNCSHHTIPFFLSPLVTFDPSLYLVPIEIEK